MPDYCPPALIIHRPPALVVKHKPIEVKKVEKVCPDTCGCSPCQCVDCKCGVAVLSAPAVQAMPTCANGQCGQSYVPQARYGLFGWRR